MVREAKDFLKSKIKQGKIDKDELKNPNSAFNQIKKLLKNSVGYVGYFTRAHYGNPENVTIKRLSDFYQNLLILRKYNDPVDVSRWSKQPFEDLELFVQNQVDIKTGNTLSGILLERDFPEIYKKLNTDWAVVISASKTKDGKYKPDINGVLDWGCPKWCIKRDNYFSNTYVKNDNYIQYIFIEREFFKKVLEAGKSGKRHDRKLVPINYDGDWESADRYVNPYDSKGKLRIGVTTKSSENLTFFNEKENLTSFDDSNGSIGTLEKFNKITQNIPIRYLDVEIRRAFGIGRSEFDVSVPTFEEIIKHIDISYNGKNSTMPKDEQSKEIANCCGKFFTLMEKLTARPEDFENVREQICPYFEDNKELLNVMLYALLYAGDLSDEMIEYVQDITSMPDKNDIRSSKNKLTKINISVTISMLHIYIEVKKKGIYIDPRLEQIVQDQIIDGFLLKWSLLSFFANSIKSVVDLKRAIITVFRTEKPFEDIDQPGSRSTRQKIMKLLANYLYMFRREKGEKIMKEQGWQAEIDFIKQVKHKVDINDNTDTEFLKKTASSILDQMPKAMMDKTEDGKKIEPKYSEIFDEISTYEEENGKYIYQNHLSLQMFCLSYYLKHINPSMKKMYLKRD